jgi:translocator protein
MVARVEKWPLAASVAASVSFAAFGGLLVGDSLGGWYDTLEKPWFLVPLWFFYIVGGLYYVLFATISYRVLVGVEDRGGRILCLSLVLSVMLLNELWNYVFFGLESTLLGFLGLVVFLAPLSALLLALREYERTSAKILVPYYLWVLYDLAWTFELWKMNAF